MREVNGKHIVVLGAARSGIAAAKLLKRKGAIVFVSEKTSQADKRIEAQILKDEKIEFEFGGHSEKIYQSDLAVLSPGIPSSTEEILQFQRIGIPLFSELEIASWFCTANLIAVTGSNGKTTTTTLLGALLQTRWPDAVVAGNIGIPLSQQVDQSLPDTWGVVEVSSFQLEFIDSFHPKIVILLNLSPNHLDRYEDYKAYTHAKLGILKNISAMDYVIGNRDDPLIYEAVKRAGARKYYFSSTDGAAQAGLSQDNLILNGIKLISLEKIALKGIHNYMNCMAAVLAAEIAGISRDTMKEILSGFSGVEHRLEKAGCVNEITFINDSKSTTVESLRVALMSFKQPIHLIAGGRDKGGDFSELAGLIKEKVSSIQIIGEARNKIIKSWQTVLDNSSISMPATLDEAVHAAYGQANAGDIVLFSPACASFDMFRNYEERGKTFKALVNALKEENEKKNK